MAALALASLAALPAAAQTEGTGTTVPQEQEAPAADAPASDELVVTGSRIVRDGYQAPTPLTVLSRDDIDNGSPTNNIADFVNQLPQLAGSTKPANSRLNLSSGQAGINALNLRNLGETRTLILVNGRRSVGSAVNGVVDVNTIPQSLIDRVEVSTGGASSAYGSDAVAGVVNFILNNKLEGLRITADSGVTTYGDGFNYSGSIAGGTSFAGGRGHVLFNAEIAHQDGIYDVNTIDRGWNHTGYVRVQNPLWTSASTTQPQYLTTRGPIGQGNSTPGGLITASAGGTTNALRGLYFGQGGSVNVFNYGTLTPANFNPVSSVAAPTLIENGSWQVNDTGRRIGLMPKDDRYGFFGRVSFEVTDGIELFAEGAYQNQKVFFNAGPNLATGISINTTGCSLATPGPNCNPFALQALGAARLTGVTGITVSTSAADLPFRAVANERTVKRGLIGAEGSFEAFGKAARWDVYAQYGRTDAHEELQNIMNTTRMANATNAVFAPAGNTAGYAAGSIVCAVNVDAFSATLNTPMANPNALVNDDRACVPLNRLGVGVASQEALDYVLGNPYRDERLEQFVTGLNLSVTPFATWAGDVSVAVGAEYRKEKIRGTVPAEFQPVVTGNLVTTRWSVGNYVPTQGEYSVKEAYLETVIPLGFGLEFNGAVRATDYSSSGYVTTWKAGATWAPIPDIRFRVTRSRDIRAPNLADLYQVAQNTDSNLTNPFGAGSGPNGTVFPQSGVRYTGTVLGNLDLVPERADSWNIGAVFSPTFLPGFNFSADYFRIDIKDAIGTYSAQQILNRCFENNADFCSQIRLDPTDSGRLLFTTQPFNFTTQLVRGIDFDGSYSVPVGEGSVTLRGVATRYIDNITTTGITGVVPVNTVGANGGQASTPTWLFRGSLTYDSPSFSATVVGRGVSSGKYAASGIECSGTCPVSTAQFPTYDNNRVSGLFYADLNLTQKIAMGSSQAEMFFNVTNLFNRWPLLVPETGLAANSTYSDMLGRQFRVGLRFNLR